MAQVISTVKVLHTITCIVYAKNVVFDSSCATYSLMIFAQNKFYRS